MKLSNVEVVEVNNRPVTKSDCPNKGESIGYTGPAKWIMGRQEIFVSATITIDVVHDNGFFCYAHDIDTGKLDKDAYLFILFNDPKPQGFHSYTIG